MPSFNTPAEAGFLTAEFGKHIEFYKFVLKELK